MSRIIVEKGKEPLDIPLEIEQKGADAVNAYVLKKTGVDVVKRRRDFDAAQAREKDNAAQRQAVNPQGASPVTGDGEE